MRRRLVAVLAVATVIGLLASVLVYRVLTRAVAPREAAAEQVVVAAANIGLAETVTSKHVRVVAWPRSAVPAGALRSVAEAEGRVVKSSFVAGEPLLEGKLAPQLAGRGGIMPMLIPEGQRGVTIKVDEAIRESGFVLPNSRVDVLVSMARHPGSLERVAKVILQDVQVLAAGQAVEMRDNKPVTVTTVTLALAPEQAERLALAQQEGKLMIATRNLRDHRIVETRGATAATLVGESFPAPKPRATATVPRPAPRVTAKAAKTTTPPPAPRLDAHTVVVVRAGKVAEQVFIRDEDRWREQQTQRR